MKKEIGILLLTTLLLTSCKDYTQKDWHINTIELADEYFPKYFEAIEESLSKNNIKYEKEYNEDDFKPKCKCYNASYYISEDIYFKFSFNYEKKFNIIDCIFCYNLVTEEQALNLPQSYINVMIDTVNFCSHNFLGTGEMYNTFYDEVKERHAKDEVNNKIEKKLIVSVYETYEDALPTRRLSLDFANEEYNLEIYLYDYLTDINIWNK